MKKFLLALVLTLLVSVRVFAAEPAVQFVNDLTDKIITNVLTTKDTHAQKLENFRKDFDNAVDLKAVGQFVLGRYWKTANETDRAAFLKSFMNFTTLTWSDRFDMYTGQKITFLGARNADGGQLYVDSKIQNGNKPVEVIWRVKEQKDGGYKIIDIIVEGVSMAMSYRNEYTAFLQKNDGVVSILTAELDTKAKNFKFGSTKKDKNKNK